ncbi:MAG TPA: ATP-binding protein, partial [Allocoleopsis sp.]
KVTLRVLAESNHAIFQVKDRGIGIAEEQMPMLFQKFHQLNAGYQRQYGGTGLGLALTKQLVEMHGGWLEVESTLGVGSIFTVHLPMQSRESGTTLVPKTKMAPVPDSAKGRIVLAESDEETAHLICDVLTAAGYQIVWMLEGLAAVEQIEVMQPTAAIINAQLTDTDGYTLIRHLRQNPATKHLKIIALAPETTSLSSLDWQSAGANDLVIQPIRPDQLLQKLVALTDRSGIEGEPQ